MGWRWGKLKPKQWGWEEDINGNNIYSTWYIFSIYENLRRKKNKALSYVSRGLSFLIPHPKRPSFFPLHPIPSTPPRCSISVRILSHRIPDHLAMVLPTQTQHWRPHAASHLHWPLLHARPPASAWLRTPQEVISCWPSDWTNSGPSNQATFSTIQ